jgi:hypothetical protein
MPISATTVLEIIKISIIVIEQLLSFTPYGYPKSLTQCFTFSFKYIFKGFKSIIYKKDVPVDNDIVVLPDQSMALRDYNLNRTLK